MIFLLQALRCFHSSVQAFAELRERMFLCMFLTELSSRECPFYGLLIAMLSGVILPAKMTLQNRAKRLSTVPMYRTVIYSENAALDK